MVNQREILELPYPLPHGDVLIHPALVISVPDILQEEGIFYAMMLTTKNLYRDFTFEIHRDMLTRPSSHAVTYACCHLVHPFPETNNLRRFGSMHKEPFQRLLTRYTKVMFGI